MLRPSLVPLLLALAPAVQGQAGPVVLLGDEVDATTIPELATAEGPVVLLSLHPNMTVERFGHSLGLARQAGETRAFFLRPGERERSDDPELLAALREARTVGLWGGQLESWYGALWPDGSKSGALAALLEAHDAGATLVARGAGVALLSAAAVWDGEWTRPEPHRRPSSPPHDHGEPQLTWNLGLQPWAAVDTEARSRGSAWDLIDLLVDERLRLGAYLEDDSALIFDPGAEELRVRGLGAVWLFDLRGARRGKGALQGARFSVLFEGDAWVPRGRTVRSPGEPRELTSGPPQEVIGPDALVLTRVEDEEGFGPPAPGPRYLLTIPFVHAGKRDEGRGARIELTPDEDSRAWSRRELGRYPLPTTVANLRLDLEWDLE